MNHDYDLIVIGAGSGGVRAARIASQYGAKVAIIEGDKYGGTCVNKGCVPKKLFSYASHFKEDFEIAKSFGWTFKKEAIFNWKNLIINKDKEIDRLNLIYKNILKKNKVDMFNGFATFIDRHTLNVNDVKITGEKILIATGGKVVRPSYSSSKKILTSDELFYLKKLPQNIVILGGGYIAAEFASILHGLGVNTTLIYRGKQILKIFDNEINSFLQNQMEKKGIKFVLEKDIEDISQLGKDQFEVLFTDKSTFKTELVLSALGRLPNIDGLNLSAIKIDLNSNNSIKVDKYSKTNLDNIFAIGDVTDRVNLTPLAIREGHAFSDSEFGNNKRYLNYSLIPTAVFTDPPLATVGLSEKEAIKRKINIKKYITSFTPMKYSLTEIDSKILMKLIVEKETDKVLGIHMVGMDSPEIIQSLAVSLTAGVTKRQFDQTIAMHPTTAEEFVTL